MSRKVIVLDPGHAINTPGKRSPDGSFREYEFAQDIANKAQQILSNYDVKVILTKNLNDNDDPDLGTALARRVRTANKAGGDVYLSIHGNAAGGGGEWMNAKGFEIFYCAEANKNSANLAQIGAKKAMDELNKFNMRNRGVKEDDFYVIRKTNMPSVLFEFGFYDNKDECENMKKQEFRIACAEAVAATAISFLGLTKPVVVESKPVYKVYGPNPKAAPETFNAENIAYNRGWALFNAGNVNTYLVTPDGSKYTFSKHPEANPKTKK
jgi:N-acetylmuramoyl-L-alanine amidase